MAADVLMMGDTMNVVYSTIIDGTGKPRDLTGATVALKWKIGKAGTLKSRGATVLDAVNGRVKTLLDQPADIDAVGICTAFHVVTDGAGLVGTQWPPHSIPVKALP